jgi:hypothetical protein
MFTKKWTGDLVGLMHTYKISKTDLAAELGVTREYVSLVLNGHRDPAGAKERFTTAVEDIISRCDTK